MQLVYDYDNSTLTLETELTHMFSLEDVETLRVELTSHTNMEDTFEFDCPIAYSATVEAPADMYTAQMIYTLKNGETVNELEIIVAIPAVPANDELKKFLVRALESFDPKQLSYEEVLAVITFLKNG